MFPGPQWTDVFYSWTEDEDLRIGLHSIGDANHIGVASTQEQLNLRSAARSMLGNTMYAKEEFLPTRNGFSEVPVGSWKCNAFVADVALSAGLSIPVQHHSSHVLFADSSYPPVANEWAKGNVRIAGWQYLGSTPWPEPGYIVGHPASIGSGHVGIVDYDGEGIGAGKKIVHRKYEEFRDGTSGFNKYLGANPND